MNCCVTIPVYKENPSEYELHSFKQCIRVLKHHRMCVFTYNSLNTAVYTTLLQRAGVDYYFEYFDSTYFDGISGYNRLLLSSLFYRRFAKYDYILIYQLDAYVFHDRLDYWCNRKIIYLGAPLEESHFKRIEKQHNNTSSHKITLNSAYNGGASLRHVQSFINITESQPETIRNLFQEGLMEDVIFSSLLLDKNSTPYSKALAFSFESNPRTAYIQNHRELPMLCHAWCRSDSELYDMDFWLPLVWPTKYYKRKIKKIITRRCK